jgi:hypothetical protein
MRSLFPSAALTCRLKSPCFLPFPFNRLLPAFKISIFAQFAEENTASLLSMLTKTILHIWQVSNTGWIKPKHQI